MPGAPQGPGRPAANAAASDGDRAISRQEALRLVAWALERVQYGEIIVKVQAGKPIWVDQYERTRVG